MEARRRLAQMAEVNTCDEQEMAAAESYAESCDYELSLSSMYLAGLLANTAYKATTEVVDTWAVSLAADGFTVLMRNPRFSLALRDEPGTVLNQGKFISAHEACHLLWAHLFGDDLPNGDEIATIAQEASINWYVMHRLKMDLPLVDGKPSGIDPRKVHEQYKRDLKGQGKSYQDIQTFYKTDLNVFHELNRMAKPPRPPRGTVQICQHGDGEGEGGQSGSCSCPQPSGQQGQQQGQGQGQGQGQNDPSGNGGAGGQSDPNCPQHGQGKVGVDRRQASDKVNQVLEIAMHEATANGNRTAKDDLLTLAERTEGSENASRIWGEQGLGALRGEAVVQTKTEFWKRWVEGRLADRLEPAMRLIRHRKIWWEETFVYDGQEPHMHLDVFIDASGSMRQSDLDWIASKVGQTEGLTVRWHSFDAHVFEMGDTGQIRGGGGTSFQIIDDFIRELDEPSDAVLVVTDGYAPHITPDEPERWIWLITPGGDDWPSRHSTPMDCFEIDTHS
jgi:hypothetical protein